ncbi:protein of unknown function [Mesotoga infera]|uniref:Uncharacterized protein n=1 Tax=Mesotoga infera TaxID=1236046 RepID=A0A7Z7PQL3_9BACT|nr:protein of unknown function [Mesotoga infera]
MCGYGFESTRPIVLQNDSKSGEKADS